jgi:hypothetical protein
VRYVDGFVLLADSAQSLTAQRKAIEVFLHDHLALEVHPHKTVMQRGTQGLNFLGAIVHQHHELTRQRSVRALRLRLAGFIHLLFARGQPDDGSLAWAAGGQGGQGVWYRWLTNHTARFASGEPTPVLRQKMLATVNSYCSMYGHANTAPAQTYVRDRAWPLAPIFYAL